ncbi:trafficking protein particle complex subunit 12 isoform X2 [Eurosta solidaginis]|uniref:trafficking protein particle complex subunit 12 isoform X2 n=1 Tax=Eurosta solidaginis TaxID=178769 RepID=UPI003530ACB9
MDPKNSALAGTSLSQYFADDPPSFFDELANKTMHKDNANAPITAGATTTPVPQPRAQHKPQTAPSNLTANTFSGAFVAPEYIENPNDGEDDLKVSDYVRNFWEPATTETSAGMSMRLPLLTTPGIQTPTDLPDLVGEAVLKHLGEADLAQRKILGVDNVTQDERGLRTLISAGCYRSAVNLTGRLLTIYGQGYGRAGQPAKHSPHSLQLWFTRLALLAKLGEFELLQAEAEPFEQLNRPDVYYEMKKFNLIDDIIRGMILESSDVSKEERRALYSAWGRIYLQIGDIFGAEQKFAEARRMREINSTPDLRDLVDKGLITVAENDFRGAYAIFQKALHLESGNTMILNNMGVCLLYEGKLKDAIKLFEHAINLNPQKSLNESLLVNLSTLYELESNISKHKKLNLLRLVNKYKPDLNISLEICLKLQSTN